MFFFFGWGTKTSEVANGGIYKCPSCQQWAAFRLMRHSSYFSLFFVPIITYGAQHFIGCVCCQAGFPIDLAKKVEMENASFQMPTIPNTIAIWNAINTAVSEAAPGPAQRAALARTALALKSTYRLGDVDYVAGVYSARLAELEAEAGVELDEEEVV